VIECRRRSRRHDRNPEVRPISFASLFRQASSCGHLQTGHILGGRWAALASKKVAFECRSCRLPGFVTA